MLCTGARASGRGGKDDTGRGQVGKGGGQVCEVGASEAAAHRESVLALDEDCFLGKTMERWEFGCYCHDPGVVQGH